MKYYIRYSFNFRYSKEHLRTVDVPLIHLVGMEFDEYVVRDVIHDNPELQAEMLGDQVEYVKECGRLEDWKSLERRNEKFEIIRK